MELKRAFHEVYCWISLLAFFPAYYYGGPILFVVQTILGGGLACLMDWHIGPTMKANVYRIVERGLAGSPFEVLLGMYLTILTSESIAVALAVMCGCYDATPRFLDATLVRNVALSIAFNEGVFTTTHRCFLHGTSIGAKLHEIHHTCRPSSFSTSFIFHFLDSNVEFTCSFVCMAAFSHCWLEDPFSLLVSMQIAYIWYTALGHSENLKFGHYYHHWFVNANYSAYSSFLHLKGRDYVRELFLKEKPKAHCG